MVQCPLGWVGQTWQVCRNNNNVYVCVYYIHVKSSVTYQQTNTIVTVHVYTLVHPARCPLQYRPNKTV